MSHFLAARRCAALALLPVLWACGDDSPSAPDGDDGKEVLVDLGTLGGDSTQALDINDRSVVVGWSRDEEGRRRPFRWTAQDGMLDLGTLGGPDGAALAVNEDGVAVGWSRDAEGRQVATRWTDAGSPHPLEAHDLGSEDAPSAATAINGAGTAVGYTHGLQLARWTPDGRAVGMVGCPGGFAFDVTDGGRVVGIASAAVGAFLADPTTGETREYTGFAWTEDAGCRGLIDEALVAHDAVAANERGDVVGLGGEWEESDGDAFILFLISAEIPFVHGPEEGFRTPPELPDEPRDINEHGLVVGDGWEAVNERGERVGGRFLRAERAEAPPSLMGWEARSPDPGAASRLPEPGGAIPSPRTASCPAAMERLIALGALPECPLPDLPTPP